MNHVDDENEDVEIVIQIPEDQVEISSAHSNGQAWFQICEIFLLDFFSKLEICQMCL